MSDSRPIYANPDYDEALDCIVCAYCYLIAPTVLERGGKALEEAIRETESHSDHNPTLVTFCESIEDEIRAKMPSRCENCGGIALTRESKHCASCMAWLGTDGWDPVRDSGKWQHR